MQIRVVEGLEAQSLKQVEHSLGLHAIVYASGVCACRTAEREDAKLLQVFDQRSDPPHSLTSNPAGYGSFPVHGRTVENQDAKPLQVSASHHALRERRDSLESDRILYSSLLSPTTTREIEHLQRVEHAERNAHREILHPVGVHRVPVQSQVPQVDERTLVQRRAEHGQSSVGHVTP